MFLDVIHGIIERRVLLNYRIRPEALADVLPHPFRPKLYGEWGVGGICMIRFRHLRPRLVPAWLGMDSENAAHRIAVEWEQNGEIKEGVFIPRRDTNSWFNKTLGGKVFPGIFNRSIFDSEDSSTASSVCITRADGSVEASFSGAVTDHLPPTSIFPTLAEAAGFFSLGATGYSSTHEAGQFHGMELKCLDWTISPLKVDRYYSAYFGDEKRFPKDTLELDCALIMRDIPHEWHTRPNIKAEQGGAANPLQPSAFGDC